MTPDEQIARAKVKAAAKQRARECNPPSRQVPRPHGGGLVSCGHAHCRKPEFARISARLTVVACVDCGHTWTEAVP